MMAPHVSSETLEEYLLGRLAGAQLAGVEEHLLLCGDCRALCIQVEEKIKAIREALKSADKKDVIH